jgi:hypothetical protein
MCRIHLRFPRRAMSVLFGLVVAFVMCTAVSSVAQTDDELWTLIEQAAGSQENGGADWVMIFDRMDVDVEDSGLAHTRHHTLRKILTDDGILEQAVHRFDYDPASNFINIERARILRKDRTIEEVDVAGARDLYAPAYMIYWGARMKLLGLPRLEIGDAVEIKTYKKGFEIAYLGAEAGAAAIGGDDEDDERYIPPMRGHFYDVVVFAAQHPILEKRYDLHLPAGKQIQFEVYNGTLYSSKRFDEKKTHYSWWLSDIPAIKREPRMAAVSDVATKVVLATVPSWEEKSRWFASVHDTIFYDNEAIKEKVREITAGLSTDLEKVAALQHWAAQEIRYSGLSMGEGEGYTIHPGRMIFDERCGVCKDKAGMLITMMRTAGYEVYPALTMAGSRVEEIPADQFNHCVVAWRHEDGGYTMLDPTWVPYSTEMFSSAEQEQNYVIGTPWGENLMITPYSPPEDHLLLVESRADIDREGNLQGTMKLSASNYMDQRMRRYLGTHRRDDLKAFIEGWLSSISQAVEVTEFSIGDPLDFASPYELEIAYRIPSFAIASEDGIDFTSPVWNLVVGNNYLFSASTQIGPKEREHPLFIWFTQKLVCDERIALPRNLTAAGDPKPIDDTGEFASFSLESTYRKGELATLGTVLIKHRTIPPGEYADFRKILKKVEEYSHQRIIAGDGEEVQLAK